MRLAYADRTTQIEPRRMYVCPVHDRWVKIVTPEGDTVRPCPECKPGAALTPFLSERPITGLTQ